MPPDEQPPPGRRRLRRGRPAAVVGLVLVALGIVVAMTLVLRNGGQAGPTLGPAQAEPPTTAAHPVQTTDARSSVVARLREILRIRDRAYHTRDVTMLADIYATDCPCLAGDGDAIRQLLSKHQRWVGSPSSIQVRDVQRVGDRLWIVVAVFRVPSLRVETTAGKLVAEFPEEANLFRFAVVRPEGSDEWLLGRASRVGKS
jgi:hypothetical protein